MKIGPNECHDGWVSCHLVIEMNAIYEPFRELFPDPWRIEIEVIKTHLTKQPVYCGRWVFFSWIFFILFIQKVLKKSFLNQKLYTRDLCFCFQAKNFVFNVNKTKLKLSFQLEISLVSLNINYKQNKKLGVWNGFL